MHLQKLSPRSFLLLHSFLITSILLLGQGLSGGFSAQILGEKQGAEEKGKTVAKNNAEVDEYPEIKGEVDHLKIIGDTGDDDFTRAEARMKAQRADKKPATDDIVEAELKKIQEAEAKAAAAQAAEDKAAALEARREARSRAKENAKLMRDYMRDARKKANELPGISREEANWRGLED